MIFPDVNDCNKESIDKLKVLAIIEVIFIEIVFFISAWFFQALYPSTYGWYSKIIMILLGLLGILIHKRLRDYGLAPKSLKFSVKWSIYIIILFTIINVAVILVAFATGLSDLRVDLEQFFIDMVWYFIFVGFAEEFFFRGYVQSRLNEVFTKKYKKILGVDFEWSQGTLITGIFLFGIPHILTGINPFTGSINISLMTLMIVFFASFLGVIFGVLREKTGGIIVPTILHGLIDFTVFGIGRIIGLGLSNIAAMIALFIFFALCFERILREPVIRQ